MEHKSTEAGPVVVVANWFAFRPAERIRYSRVMSRCFLWVVEGSGEVRSGGARLRLCPGMVLTLPWGHDIEYRADSVSPFRLGTVLVVPEHSHESAVMPTVAHMPEDPLFKDPARSGGAPSDLRAEVPLLGDAASDASRRIAELGRYVVERYTGAPFDEPIFRALGRLMVAEGDALMDSHRDVRRMPAAVHLMTAYVVSHLSVPLRVADVAQAGGCSSATAERLFSRNLGSSIAVWVRGVRMREAATLLRTTSMRVGEVARAVGYEDQLYFSRVFRAAYGMPPSAYAAESRGP
jgi:AraC-like DNA-binding protein